MDKLIEIKKYVKEETAEVDTMRFNFADDALNKNSKTTNPIKFSDNNVLKNLSKFTNQKLSNKFNINDLLR